MGCSDGNGAGFRLGIAQMASVLGDVDANLDKIALFVRESEAAGVDLLLFPELTLSGYPVDDCFAETALRPDAPQVGRLRELSRRVGLVVGFVEETEDTDFFNSAMVLAGGKLCHVHRKVYLPNYRIFNERRAFTPGWDVRACDTPWGRMGILICGDCWHVPLAYLLAQDGADVLLFLAASSREGLTHKIGCRDAWRRMNRCYGLTLSSFVAFANFAHAEQGFDYYGGSHVVLPNGNVLAEAGEEEELLVADLDLGLLREQRLILPFRRDDNLAFTLRLGDDVLRRQGTRLRGFHAMVEPPERPVAATETPGPGGGAVETAPPAPPPDLTVPPQPENETSPGA